VERESDTVTHELVIKEETTVRRESQASCYISLITAQREEQCNNTT